MTKIFHVVGMRKDGTVQVVGGSDSPMVWGNGNQAAAYAQMRTAASARGVKYQVRLAPSQNPEDWKEREKARFKSGEYFPVPWHAAKWLKKNKECEHHFVHVAKGNASMLAYTPDEAYGQQDRQVRMSPSKYLARFYGKIIAERTIKNWCAAYKRIHGSEHQLKFAYTADDIVRVYRVGPHSCMKNSERVAAYAGPDLAVAYVERKGRIVARAVVWPKKKWYYTMYGDRELLKHLLDAEGFTYHSLVGARLTHDSVSSYGLPSIDSLRTGCKRVGGYWVIA